MWNHLAVNKLFSSDENVMFIFKIYLSLKISGLQVITQKSNRTAAEVLNRFCPKEHILCTCTGIELDLKFWFVISKVV